MAQSVSTTISHAERLSRQGEAPTAALLFMSVLMEKPANRRARDGLNKLRAKYAAPTQADLDNLRRLFTDGQYDEAFRRAQPLLALFPDCIPLILIAGAAKASGGDHADAEQWFARVLALAPDNADAAFNLGGVLRAQKRHEEARAAFETAHRLAPKRVDILSQLGLTLLDLDDFDAAAERFRAAADLDPGQMVHRIALGETETLAGRPAAAAEAFDAARQIDPTSKVPSMKESHVSYQMEDTETAERAARAVLELDPSDSFALNQLGQIRMSMGDREGARDAYEQALVVDPTYFSTYLNIANVPGYQPDSARLEEMRRIAAEGNLSDNERSMLCFALFKALDKLGETEEAFAHLETANRLRRAEVDFDIARERQTAQLLRDIFRGDLPSLGDAEPAASVPIFVLGMPRSGTTLVEQIISSHNAVLPGGELETLSRSLIGARLLEFGATPEVMSRVRQSYISGTARRNLDQRPFFTDKMPGNFMTIGAILTALPEARIVHLRRDPRPVCWSGYQRFFRNRSAAISYTYDQLDLAEYVTMHDEMMAFWHQRFPGRVFELDYQRLVDEPEPMTRQLIDAIGLDWDPACLDFHKSTRAIRTASAGQVHKPIYKGSNEAWRRYEAHLGPLLTRLRENGCLEGYE
ncbi:TPR domain protein [Rhodovulum sp. P5]|uniref:tetratricopeptide repeat-containing sulfotransferase family protein n=1 Tax=Rhodovulum sp. P5 TaxID=1564506 RepID=UPI0009C2E346|nr:tetratricopeptide repeat-containing sulfotransferase family protein [Rhodovulum sp. P5]ARE41070.1 TPR domain protein [Rhodovulum sp. P5]